MDEDLEALKPATPQTELERWNLEDLEEYKARLLSEANRVDAVIKSKSSVFSEAENLFKSK